MASSVLSADKLKEAKEAFSLFDRDGDGKVDQKELMMIIKSMGYTPAQSDLDVIYDKCVELKYEISFQNFIDMVDSKLKDLDAAAELVSSFKTFDRENNGSISTMELKCVLETLGEELTETEVEELLKEADPNNTGAIPYQEFVQQLLTYK
eukprot:GHVU01027666.1.p1 GENE.GHVU01027666.1~~GHVU01027666.1.p1  ORF type:complete len:151 (-),score=42.06 GHVU01027666.1:313-765(-)